MALQKPLRPFDGSAIPADLKAFPRWAPWRAAWNEKRGKWDKIPHRASSPDYGLSTAKPEQWSPFAVAFAAFAKTAGRFAGVGYCMTKPHGIVGVDLDDCLENGVPAPWAAEVVADLGSYTERSPSGNGLRILVKGAVPNDWNNHEVGIEVYGGNEPRFLTVTGEHVEGTPFEVRAVDASILEALAAKYAKARKKAEVIDLAIPDVMDDLVIPSVEALPLHDKALTFLTTGDCEGDRSGALHAAGVALYSAGLDDDVVFSILANNEYAMGVALDHRRQDRDRALMYLWREHCVKAKGKASLVATADEFEAIEAQEGDRNPLPPFKRDKHGKIEASIENVALAVRRADLCGMWIKYDEFRAEITFASPGGNDWRPFGDTDYSRLRITLEKAAFKPIGRDLIRDVVELVANENKFDSAILWIESLPWDGVPRVENFLRDYFGAADSLYVRSVSLYTWTALAGRVLSPGIKADMVPILVGEQGSIKSSGLAAMVPSADFFTEISFNEKDDDQARRMRGCLLAEIGELRGLHSRELESIKAFITRTHESWVPKYKEFKTLFPRRLLFIGTTNKEEFLADETGNRRWLPVRTGLADIKAVKRDREQLWAEARVLFELLGVAYQTAEELGKEAHAEHTITDPWAEDIARWLDEPDSLTGEIPRGRDFLRVSDVAREALRLDAKQVGKREEARICVSLRACGFMHTKRRVNKIPLWVWVKCSIPVPSYSA